MPSCKDGVESLNQTLLQWLRCTEFTKPWDDRLGDVILAYNNLHHSSVGMNTVECIFSKSYNFKTEGVRVVIRGKIGWNVTQIVFHLRSESLYCAEGN